MAQGLELADSMTRRLLTDWIPGDNGTALDTLLQLGGGGLNAELFDGPGFTNPEPDGRVASAISMQAPAGGAPCGARWSGYLLPLGDGPHTFVLRTDGSCSIKVGDSDVTTFPSQLDDGRPLMMDNTLPSVTLSANQLVRLEVTYDRGAAPGSFSLLWKLASGTTPTPIAAEYLFPTLTSLLQDSQGPGFIWKRAHKASLLIRGLGLTENEISYAESQDHPSSASFIPRLTNASSCRRRPASGDGSTGNSWRPLSHGVSHCQPRI